MRKLSTTRGRPASITDVSRRSGITLLEVVIAVAIFLAAMTAITRLVTTGTRASVRGQLQTEAILRCESKLGEVIAGIEPLEPVDSQPMPTDDGEGWVWSMQVIYGDDEYAPLSLEIMVQHLMQDGSANAAFTIYRTIRDPQLFVDAALAEEEAAAEDEE